MVCGAWLSREKGNPFVQAIRNMVKTLYSRAFAQYGTQALWNMRPIEDPTPADVLAIAKALRTHGGMEGRRLAERIEKVCRAPH
jgi:hypothetical protein